MTKLKPPKSKTFPDRDVNVVGVVPAFSGIMDRNNKPIMLGDTVKVLVGKPNTGYKVVFEAGAFCLTGKQIGTCSFIKFRDELIEGRITGTPVIKPFERFLQVVHSAFNVQATAGTTAGTTGGKK